MRILIVEDEPDLLSVLAQSLREDGYAVDTAEDGEAGLQKACDGNYGIILLDVMLPKIDGFELLRRLRRSKTTPVLMLTARDAVGDRVQGLDVGADDYLTKPFEMAELLARVRAMIRRNAGGAVEVDEIGQVTADDISDTVSRLEAARRVQMRMTPTLPAKVPQLDMAFVYEPAQFVGGDYCDIWWLSDGRLACVVADVSGKGLSAALVMANLQGSLHAGIEFCPGPAEAVAYVNQHLLRHLPVEIFVTMFLALLEVETGRLEYVNAGHPTPLLLLPAASGVFVIEPLAAPSNMVLAVGEVPYSTQVRHLPPGAAMVAYTDGITESMSPEGELFGIERVQSILEAVCREAKSAGETSAAPADECKPTAQQMVQALNAATSRFRGASVRQDDVTLLAIRWLGKPAS